MYHLNQISHKYVRKDNLSIKREMGCDTCSIIKRILCLHRKNKPIPKELVFRLIDYQPPESTEPIVGPYLQLITDILYPKNGTPLFSDFSFNIQYYNQGNYYSEYNHVFTDETDGPYGMTQSASCQAISTYLKGIYDEVPKDVSQSIVVGKLLTPEAGGSGYVDLNTLNSWFEQAQTHEIPFGGFMFWSSGFYSDLYPNNLLVTETFKNVESKYKVMYIGSGSTGQVYTAEGEPLYAQTSDPNGDNARNILTSYAQAGFNRLILAFWNYDSNSDWITDWTSINKDAQKQLIDEIHSINPDCLVISSASGAYGNVGPNSGVSGTEWGKSLAQYAIDNNLDGVDLDLEGSMLGVQWTQDQYDWLKDAVNGIADISTDLSISFAPVAPLMANPNS